MSVVVVVIVVVVFEVATLISTLANAADTKYKFSIKI